MMTALAEAGLRRSAALPTSGVLAFAYEDTSSGELPSERRLTSPLVRAELSADDIKP
jgi:hypothetical protein